LKNNVPQINGKEYLLRKDAINYLGLEKTQFKNISQIGKEIEMLKHKGKWYVSKEECDRLASPHCLDSFRAKIRWFFCKLSPFSFCFFRFLF